MSTRERRVDTRVNLRVPLRFRALSNPNTTEQFAESENVSQRGIYFETAVPLKVGAALEVSLRIPQEITGKTHRDVHCMGRVVHVRPAQGEGGKLGIGLYIERYEARLSADERWAS